MTKRVACRFGFAILLTPLAVSLLTGCGHPGTRPDGAKLLYSPSSNESAQNPAFSPDGKTVLFTEFHEGYNMGPAGLFLVRPDGGKPEELLDEPDTDSVNLPGSSWNRVTGLIAFSSDRAGPDEIHTMSLETTDPSRVTRHKGDSFFIEPSFSPDGKWIVFEEDVNAPEDRQQHSIWKVRSDGRKLARLTDGPEGGTDDRQPNWSPAGERILFQRIKAESDSWDIYTMSSDGNDIRRVTGVRAGNTDASWSPDGRCIVYSSDNGNLSHPNIFIIPADGGTPIRLTRSKEREDGAPSWSPDGKWIAFESHENADEDSPTSLWLIKVPRLIK